MNDLDTELKMNFYFGHQIEKHQKLMLEADLNHSFEILYSLLQHTANKYVKTITPKQDTEPKQWLTNQIKTRVPSNISCIINIC